MHYQSAMDYKAKRYDSVKVCRKQNQPRSRAFTLPSRLHNNSTHERAKKLKSLDENVLSTKMERSYTFAVNYQVKNWRDDNSSSIPQIKAYNTEGYSPKVTKSFSFDSPLEQFKKQHTSQITSNCGQVKVMFQYLNKSNEFHCKLLRVSNIATGTSSPLGIYAKVSLFPGKKCTKLSKHKYNSCDPVFNETFIYKISLDRLIERKLKFVFYNKPRRVSLSQQLGVSVIDLSKYDITTLTVMFEDIKKDDGEHDCEELKLGRKNTRHRWWDTLFQKIRH